MKRFLMLVGVAVVAAAMYVAASPASQQAKAPTVKQFKALKAQVATLAKKLKTTQNDLDSFAAVYLHCSLHSRIGISQRGSTSTGYLYGTPSVTPAPTATDRKSVAEGMSVPSALGGTSDQDKAQ